MRLGGRLDVRGCLAQVPLLLCIAGILSSSTVGIPPPVYFECRVRVEMSCWELVLRSALLDLGLQMEEGRLSSLSLHDGRIALCSLHRFGSSPLRMERLFSLSIIICHTCIST